MRRRTNRLGGGGRTVLWDSFTDAEDANILDHPANSGGPWTRGVITADELVHIYVKSNRAQTDQFVQGVNICLKRGSNRRSRAVSADIIRTGVLASGFIGVNLLYNHPQSFIAASTGRLRFINVRYSAGSWTIIRDNAVAVGSSVSQTLTQDQVYRMRVEARGSRILLFVDNVLVQNAEMVWTRGRSAYCGIYMQNNAVSDTNLRMDNWMATR